MNPPSGRTCHLAVIAMVDCIFCKIIEGKIPSTKIFEDDHSIAIFDINPIAKGHTLFISKKHYSDLLEVPPEKLASILTNLPRVVAAILKATGAEGFNIIQNNKRCAGQLIPHLHFHIIPRKTGDKVHFNWQPLPADKDEMTALASKVKQSLSL